MTSQFEIKPGPFSKFPDAIGAIIVRFQEQSTLVNSPRISGCRKIGAIKYIDAGHEVARSGSYAKGIEAKWSRVIARHGFEKPGRWGYAIDLSYTREWRERTVSFPPGNKKVFQSGMTFNLMP